MDVTLLGPSIMALGELCQEANHVLNGEKTAVRVLLHADIKGNCVTLRFEVIQSAWEAVKALIEQKDVATSKEILDWLGILIPGGGGIWGLIKFLQWKKDRAEKSTVIKQENGKNVVIVNIEGDNNSVTLPEQVYALSKSTKVVQALKRVVAPITKENGIEEAVFIHDQKEQTKVDQAGASDLMQAGVEDEINEPQIFTAHIIVYAPVLDKAAKKSKFHFQNQITTVDISETKIAEDAVKRGGVTCGDTYKVKMEMIERKTAAGGYVSDYKVKEVLEFKGGHMREQTTLL